MSDTSISNVMAIRAEVIARSRALRAAQPTAPPGVTPTAPASNFADTLNAVVAKVNEKHMSVAKPPTLQPSRSSRAAHPLLSRRPCKSGTSCCPLIGTS
jgi:hypothetical protein